jgi:septal ring factor EnvC (AmiA/AmiB activator)
LSGNRLTGRRSLRQGIGIAVLLAGVMLAARAGAQDDTAQAARAAAERLSVAAALLDGADDAQDQIAALTETVRAYEDGLALMRDGLRRVTISRQSLEARLAARSEEVAALLAVLQTIDPATAPVLLLHPSGALGTARTGMILADVTPAIQAEVDSLRADLADLAALRSAQEQGAATLAQGLDGVQAARERLAAAVSDRTDLPRRFTEDPAAVALLLASTQTLDAFAAGLGATVQDELDTAVADATALKGRIPLPVQGEVIRRAGEADAAGIVRPGIVIAARARALVTTPVAATVRFRGPLLDYGNVVILESAPGVLFVLAGMAEVWPQAGEILPAGAPVGLMGGDQPTGDSNLTDVATSGAEARPETLYLEVRDGQGPANPADWFALE